MGGYSYRFSKLSLQRTFLEFQRTPSSNLKALGMSLHTVLPSRHSNKDITCKLIRFCETRNFWPTNNKCAKTPNELVLIRILAQSLSRAWRCTKYRQTDRDANPLRHTSSFIQHLWHWLLCCVDSLAPCLSWSGSQLPQWKCTKLTKWF